MAVYKRNNMWYIDYFIRVNGKLERRREPVSTRKDIAETRLKEYKQIIKEGKDPLKNDLLPEEINDNSSGKLNTEILTLEQFFPIFQQLHAINRSKSMQISYTFSLKHLSPVFGKLRLNEINKVKVNTYRVNRMGEGASNSTINREIACLKCVLSKAVEWEYLEKSPLYVFKMLKEPPPIERYLTKEEAALLIKSSPDYLREIITFALGTGMRKSEILNLQWTDITLNRPFHYGEISVIGKGDKKRNIRTNKTVYDLLVKKIKERTSLYVFPSTITNKNIVDIKTAFSSALKKAGIKNFRFHDLRHTAASWMVQGGADIYSVQLILGHSNIKTTQRYAHLSPEYLGKQIGIIDQYFSLEETKDRIINRFEREVI